MADLRYQLPRAAIRRKRQKDRKCPRDRPAQRSETLRPTRARPAAWRGEEARRSCDRTYHAARTRGADSVPQHVAGRSERESQMKLRELTIILICAAVTFAGGAQEAKKHGGRSKSGLDESDLPAD